MAQEGEVNTSDWLSRNVVPREDLEESRTGTRQLFLLPSQVKTKSTQTQAEAKSSKHSVLLRRSV